ncbi:MAG: molybdopterin converting factor subunit 1 [Planctomycetes bacterium]|nr:molybdopterin converting factor subunit 1 [Planctomycetota bacterium]
MRILVFARFRDLLGRDVVEMELPTGATVRELRDRLGDGNAELATLLGHSQVAINGEFAEDTALVRAGDEIALIPPVSGG